MPVLLLLLRPCGCACGQTLLPKDLYSSWGEWRRGAVLRVVLLLLAPLCVVRSVLHVLVVLPSMHRVSLSAVLPPLRSVLGTVLCLWAKWHCGRSAMLSAVLSTVLSFIPPPLHALLFNVPP